MNEVTIQNNLPAEMEAEGLDFLRYENPLQLHVNQHKDTGILTLPGMEKPLTGPGESIKIIPIGAISFWDYLEPGQAKPIRRDLVDAKNCTLKDWEKTTIKDPSGRDIPVERRKNISLFAIIVDMEEKGPVIFSLRGQKLSFARRTILNDLMEMGRKKVPIFSQSWAVSSKQEMNPSKQKYYVYEFKKDSPIVDKTKLEWLHGIYTDCKNSQTAAIDHSLEDDSGTAQE